MLGTSTAAHQAARGRERYRVTLQPAEVASATESTMPTASTRPKVGG